MLVLLLASGLAAHPYAPTPGPVPTLDLSAAGRAARDQAPPPPAHEGLPPGWVQAGSVVLPAGVADGSLEIDPVVMAAPEDIPGNKYPRKHTLYVNFQGADMEGGTDISAENRSTLARVGPYPAFQGSEQTAAGAIQQLAADLEPFGVRVMSAERPPKVLPYTMAMVGGHWTDTTIEDPAAGVAPGADCGALGQRHVVYAFASSGWTANQIANTVAQEAGHAWGLDHTFNCASVMSYCSAGTDGVFSDTCDDLCEDACQGPAGCRLFHEDFCGVGNDQQNEQAELTFLFGTNEPDVVPPTVDIEVPEDGLEVEIGATVPLRAVVDDDYGGFGWRYVIEKNGVVVADEVAYDRAVDDEYRASVNLSALEEGFWTFTVEAMDHGDNVTRDSVMVIVGDPEPLPADSGGSESSSGEGSSTAMADDDDGGGSGCGCRSTSPRAPAIAWMSLVLAVTRRRRGRIARVTGWSVQKNVRPTM